MIEALIIILFGGIVLFGVYHKFTNAYCTTQKRLDGKTVLVTGGTSGIGLEAACEMARRGARVLVAGPCPREGEDAARRVARAATAAGGVALVRYLPLDLGDCADTRRAAADLLRTETSLHILVNNAGVASPFNRTTDDGINYVMQVNYFGTFQLTLLLLPLLIKSGQPGDASRIVNTASILHRVGTVDLDNIACKKAKFLETEYYNDSKFCVVLFTRELARRLREMREENVVVNSVDPGFVGTRIFSKWCGVCGWAVAWLCYCCCKTPWQGAQTTLHAALDKCAGTVSGEYFDNCRVSRAVSRAYNDALAKKVWDESLRLVKLNDFK